MTLAEAVKTGLPYKRIDAVVWIAPNCVYALDLVNALAEDYIVQQKQVTITLEDLLEASNRATACERHMVRHTIMDLAKELRLL